MRLVFLGTPDFAVPSLEALLGAGHDVACVVTQPDRPSGRHRRPTPPPVKALAARLGVPVRQTENVNEPAFLDGLAQLRPDLVVVAAFGQKLGRRLLDAPPHGCINVHASLLPRHRGAAPVAHAILAGDRETGVTVQRMAEKIDAGDILLQEATPIGPRETAGELTDRLAALGARLVVQAVADVAAGRASPTPQDPSKATRAPMLRKEDGAIDWGREAGCLDRFVRAMAPWPGAYTIWTPPAGQPVRLVVAQAEPAGGGAGRPGRLAALGPDRISVETGEGLLHIVRLQPAGGRPMSAADFLRGHRLALGDLLGPGPPLVG